MIVSRYYWTAIVGWTGSTMFERDLRRWARTKGKKFWSGGIVNRVSSQQTLANSEREVFELMDLEYIRQSICGPSWMST